jgi:hypothetical protein
MGQLYTGHLVLYNHNHLLLKEHTQLFLYDALDLLTQYPAIVGDAGVALG